jgi:hypothetical protein
MPTSGGEASKSLIPRPGPVDALRMVMQLTPNGIPEPLLIFSLDAEERRPAGGANPAIVKRSADKSAGGRRMFLRIGLSAVLLALIGFLFWERTGSSSSQIFPTFIKARTTKLADTVLKEAAPVVAVQLSPDMVRVSAIALGHPRLAVINDKTVAEGDSVTLQALNSSVALILRVAKITDGAIILSDGRKTFSAQLTIPSPPRPKAL